MSGLVNRERVNDTAKLIMHRLVARAICRDPSLVEKAKAVLAQHLGGYSCVQDWNDILSLPVTEVRHRLTSRDENMTRLRVSSPFAFLKDLNFADVDLRRRIWRDADQMASASFNRVSHDRVAA
jgi:hypothetical protein